MSEEERPRRQGDPFRGRLNFPGFDEAMEGGERSGSNTNTPPNEALDQSVLSNASTNYTSLSIGARAALNEHMRHVAKYGLDDSHHSDRMEAAAEEEGTPPQKRDPRDEAWDRLLETSPNISHISASNTSVHSIGDTFRFERVIHQSSEAGEEAVEVMADQSSDYFNTSRVMELQTPERNLSRKIVAVTTRQDASAGSFGSSSPDVSDDDDASPTMMSLFHQASKMQARAPETHASFPDESAVEGNNDHSFSGSNEHSFSLSGVDLSRISADGSDVIAPPRRTPDSSFATLHDHRSTIDEMRAFMPPVEAPGQDVMPHQYQRRQVSPPFRKSPPRTAAAAAAAERRSPPTKRGSPPSATAASAAMSRENVPNFAESLALSPIGSRVSSVAAGSGSSFAGDKRSRTGQPKPFASRQLFPATQSQPSLWRPGTAHLRRTETDQNLSSMIVEYTSSRDDGDGDERESEVSPLHSSSSGQKNKSSGSSSLETNRSNLSVLSLSHHSSSLLPSGDRRHYRTVVPSRVYWKDQHPDEFPEQYDSFSAPLPQPHKPAGKGRAAKDDRSFHSSPR